jgi:hypothetical protein
VIVDCPPAGRHEQLCLPPRPAHVWAACVDAEGRVLDDRSEAIRPWIGRHFSELPQPVKIVWGVDPLVVLGYTSTPSIPPPPGATLPTSTPTYVAAKARIRDKQRRRWRQLTLP